MKKKIWIVGQAPARSGDGRPFTGPSGDRLVKLMGLSGYDELADRFQLDNLIQRPMLQKVPGKSGDHFPRAAANKGAERILQNLPMDFLLIACGQEVRERLRVAMPRSRRPKYCSDTLVWEIWFPSTIGHVMTIPHPSGANRHWNKPENVERVGTFLRALASSPTR